MTLILTATKICHFFQSLQQGKHNELKKKRGLYWELIRQQEIEEEIEEMRGHFF